MKAQLTIEFMGIFLVTIAFISLLVMGMSALNAKSKESAFVLEKTVRVEEVARALDTYSNSGISLIFNIGYRGISVQDNKVIAEEGGKAIVVEGVFNGSSKQKEPV